MNKQEQWREEFEAYVNSLPEDQQEKIGIYADGIATSLPAKLAPKNSVLRIRRHWRRWKCSINLTSTNIQESSKQSSQHWSQYE